MSELVAPPSTPPSAFSDSKNTIIIILLVLVVFSFIGINLLTYSGNLLERIGKILGPIIANLLSMLGFSTGKLINSASDVAADGANLGIDIAKGTSHSIGDLLINASQGGMSESQRHTLEQALSMPRCAKQEPPALAPAPQAPQAPPASGSSEPKPTPTTDPIVAQNLKSGWCYVGEFNGTRGCVEFENSGCSSGQVFPSQAACLAPTK